MDLCAANVRFWSKSGHAVLRCTCPLMTQSGHQAVGPFQSAGSGCYDRKSLIPGGTMARRTRSGSPAKDRRRNRPKARKAPISHASPANLQDKLDQLTRELDDARQRETATSEVLKVINSSPGKLKPVFQAMLEQATRICDAKFGIVFRYEGGLFHPVASLDLPPALADFMAKQGAFAPQRGQLFGRLCESNTVINVVDRATDPNPSPSFRYGGARSSIAVPMLKGNELIGAFFIYRTEVRPFTDKQIELVQNFAAQAVIAIENARLFNELRQRTGDLSEALEQQTATSEVLKVISSSPGELKTVFQTLLENATRICEAAFGSMLQREGDVFRRVALHNAPAAFAEFHSRAPLVDPRKVSDLKRVVETKQVVHVADTAAEHPDAPIAKYAGGRTLLIVPMLKDEELIGIVGIYRQEVRPFSDKQIEIVKNFASQAVIAIENTRLLNELRESLQQQTATADVLKVISSSPGDMKPVFETMLRNALHICEAKFGHLLLYDGECFHAAHLHDVPPAYREYWQKHGPIRPSPNTGLGRIVRDKQMFHIPDLKADAAYAAREPLRVVTVEQAGARSFVGVPMLKEDKLVGAIVIYRQEVRPFTERQIELLKNFAAQAVIAIDNTRLLNELRESLQHQTATSEILASISGAMTDTKPVFDAIVRNLLRLFGTCFATIQLLHDGIVEMPAAGGEAGIEKIMGLYPRPLDDTTAGGQAMLSRQVVQFSPVVGNPLAPQGAQQIASKFDYNSIIAAPMIRQDKVIGAIICAHREQRVFNEKEVALIRAFADQAVIAIENVRLFDERGSPHARTSRLPGRPAHHARSAGPDTKARVTWTTDCRHRPRDQEPA